MHPTGAAGLCSGPLQEATPDRSYHLNMAQQNDQETIRQTGSGTFLLLMLEQNKSHGHTKWEVHSNMKATADLGRGGEQILMRRQDSFLTQGAGLTSSCVRGCKFSEERYMLILC